MNTESQAANRQSVGQQNGQSEYSFFVYIIESPSAPDLYHGRSEGTLVAQALSLDRIPCISRTAINLEAFIAAIKIGLHAAMKAFPGRYPILHISAHGATQGIQLSSSEMVTWSDLRNLLIPINETLGGALLLCMSACKGYSACQMAMQTQPQVKHPYFAMVGNFSEPTWSDTAVAYLAFYHLLAKGKTVPECVVAMNAASGIESWIVESAQATQHSYIDFLISQSQVDYVQHELESISADSNLSSNAKALEGSGK